MTTLAQAYFFLLGVACGVALLPVAAYRRVTPIWLRGLLIACGLLVIGRYLVMALFASPDAPERFGAVRRLWFGSAIGLTVPSAFAVDQLLRHPAMTPKRLLGWLAPFIAIGAAILLIAEATLVPDPLIGWSVRLLGPWRWLLPAAEGAFVVAFLAIVGLLVRKLPSGPMRRALWGLAAGQALLGLDGLIVALGGWYVRPFLYTEMLMGLALWHAYETAFALQGR